MTSIDALRPVDSADSVGMVIHGTSRDADALRGAIIATEWRAYAELARSMDWIFVAVGRPWRADGDGFYALARNAFAVPAALAAANDRIASHGSRATAWYVVADDEVTSIARDALAECAAVEGSA